MFYIKLVNKIIQINNQYPYVESRCRGYLVEHGLLDYSLESMEDAACVIKNKAFMSNDTDNISMSPHDITIQIPIEVIRQERDAAPQFSLGYCESICIYREICRKLLPYRILLLHAAVISFNGQGYAFTAPPGTGKSTHISLWKEAFGEQVQIINGDKPLLAYEEDKDCFVAYGTPWCGKEGWGCDSSVPVKKICFLKQGKENSIKKAEPEEVLNQLFYQLLFPEEEKLLELELELLDMLITRVSFYEMTCDISLEAVQTACKVMCDTEGLCGVKE